MNSAALRTVLCLAALAGIFLLAAPSVTLAQPTPPPMQLPELSVGVLSEDPGYGPRWSTTILPFGNYVGPDSGRDVFCRTYLKFPVPAVPQDGSVQANLYVYVDDYWPGPGSAPISVYPVLEEWAPEAVDWYDMAAWPELGEAAATSQVTSDRGWFTWDVSRLVWEWSTGTRPNYGLALAAADLYSTASNWAAARRLTAEDPGTRPRLALLIQVPATEVPQTPPSPSPTSTSTPQPPPPTPQPPPPPTAPPPPPTATPLPLPPLLPESGASLPAPIIASIRTEVKTARGAAFPGCWQARKPAPRCYFYCSALILLGCGIAMAAGAKNHLTRP